MAYSVLIADDQNMSRKLFESFVEGSENYTLAFSADRASIATEYCRKFPVDLVIMDVVMKDGRSGLDEAERIKGFRPETKIIIVTSMPESSFITRARTIGVESFWYKEVEQAPFVSVMDRTMAGESVYPDSAPVVTLGLAKSSEFTERELEVLKLLVSGLSDQEIADSLCVSFSAVRYHVNNMLQKTGYTSRTMLAIKASQSGIVVPL